MNTVAQDIVKSMKQAVAISRGEMEPARVTRYEIADVKAIRAKLGVTQKELANAIDVTVDTVSSWEQRRRNPTGLANKVLGLLEKEPELLSKFSAHQ